MLNNKIIETIDEYILQFERIAQSKLIELKNVILEVIPDAEQTMGYGIPTFKLNKNIIHFAYFKTHIGIYPGPKAIEHFKEELKGYKTAKGTIQISHDVEIPFDLIKKIVEFNTQELSRK
jgi:uncharacterized protein YdhG (YjbR/CyaY superfamily)